MGDIDTIFFHLFRLRFPTHLELRKTAGHPLQMVFNKDSYHQACAESRTHLKDYNFRMVVILNNTEALIVDIPRERRCLKHREVQGP